jgi:tRNA wybutosine-synthesizing protein 3
MGLGLESLVGTQVGTRRGCTVSPEYLQTLVEISNERFVENRRRIERFREAFREVFVAGKGDEREDAGVKRKRMRMEGLRKREILREEGSREDGAGDGEDEDTADI